MKTWHMWGVFVLFSCLILNAEPAKTPVCDDQFATLLSAIKGAVYTNDNDLSKVMLLATDAQAKANDGKIHEAINKLDAVVGKVVR